MDEPGQTQRQPDRVVEPVSDPEVLWDAATFRNHPEKLKAHGYAPLKLTDSQYTLLQSILHDGRLSFGGDIQAAIREAIDMLTGYYAKFLDSGGRTMLHAVRQTQARLSAERYATTFEDKIEEQAGNLRVWTSIREWDAVIAALRYWDEHIAGFPVAAWQARVASIWLTNDAIQKLHRVWMEEMEPGQQQIVQEIFGRWRRLARL